MARTHVVELKSKFVANDLDLVESRALHSCLPLQFENDANGDKAAWRAGFRKRLGELASQDTAGTLKAAGTRHPAYKVRMFLYAMSYRNLEKMVKFLYSRRLNTAVHSPSSLFLCSCQTPPQNDQ